MEALTATSGHPKCFTSRRPNNHWGKIGTSYINTEGKCQRAEMYRNKSWGWIFFQCFFQKNCKCQGATCSSVLKVQLPKISHLADCIRIAQKNHVSGNNDVPDSSAGLLCCLPPAATLQTCRTCSSPPCDPPAGCTHKHKQCENTISILGKNWTFALGGYKHRLVFALKKSYLLVTFLWLLESALSAFNSRLNNIIVLQLQVQCFQMCVTSNFFILTLQFKQ